MDCRRSVSQPRSPCSEKPWGTGESSDRLAEAKALRNRHCGNGPEKRAAVIGVPFRGGGKADGGGGGREEREAMPDR